MKKQASPFLFIAACCVLLSGCASGLSYRSTSDAALLKIDQGKVKAAFASGDSRDVLYNMESGSVQRMANNYKKSNAHFAQAQRIIAAWSNSWKNTTTGKMSANFMSMLVNDNVNSYQPKGYEKSFVATFSALNQLDLNSLANARVAIKQMYETERAIQNYRQASYNAAREAKKKNDQNKLQRYLYKQMASQYDFQDLNSPAVLKLRNSYQNAFSHYLAGFVFEALNEPSLSRPGYVKAGQLNPTNTLIANSIKAVDNGTRPAAGHTDLLIVQAVGHAPEVRSVEKMLQLNLSNILAGDGCIKTVNIFYPKLILDKANAPLYAYQLDKKVMKPLPMTNVNLMAQRALKDNMPHIILRNITAMVRDIATAKLACHAGGKSKTNSAMLSLGAALLAHYLDKADERTWVLLPAHININRVSLPYGKHTLAVRLKGKVHRLTFTLNKAYQVLTYRMIGKQVFFEPEQSMETK